MSSAAHEAPKRVQHLVVKYEKMLSLDTYVFFSVEDIECIIEYYRSDMRLQDAQTANDYAIRLHPYQVEFFLSKSQLLIDSTDYEAAIACLEKAATLDGQNIFIFLLKAEALLSLDCPLEAFDALQYAKKVAATDEIFDVHLALSSYYEELLDYKKAFQEMTIALQAQPHNEEALYRMWFIVELSSLYQESIVFHEKLIDQAPYSAVAWHNLGYAYARQKRYEKAIDALEYAYTINQQLQFAYSDRGEALIQLELYEKAIECYQLASEYVEMNATMLTSMGLCFEQIEDTATAQSCYNKAIQIDPEYCKAYYYLGEHYSKKQKWKSARTSYESAFHLNKKNASYLVALAETHYQLEDHDQALHFFENACDIAPDEWRNWVKLAAFHVASEDYTIAIEKLEEATTYIHDSFELQYCKISCLYRIGRLQEVLVLLQDTLLNDTEKKYDILFELAPEMQQSPIIMNLINGYA